MRIGERIAQRRRELHLTQDELARRMGYRSKAAISKIETNINDVSQTTLTRLAEVLETTPAALMGCEAEPAVRPAPRPKREIDPIYDALNDRGQRELCRYGRYLGEQEEYRAPAEREKLVYIRHYLVPAAAGYASPIEGEDYEDIPLPAAAPAGADFCITVRGDSMEPWLRDGDLAYVRRGEPLQEFDAGVFYVDGDVLCKQWCIDYAGTLHLLSANPRREDANRSFPRSSGQTVVCFGRVLLPRRLPRPDYAF